MKTLENINGTSLLFPEFMWKNSNFHTKTISVNYGLFVEVLNATKLKRMAWFHVKTPTKIHNMYRLGVGSLQPFTSSATTGQQRGFATLKDISMRLKSVKNIQKITKSMKMVAAAKYAKAERDLKGARAYGIGAKAFFDNIEPKTEEGSKEEKQKQLLVLVTSDRGLCGSVHSSIAKEAKLMLANAGQKDIRIVCIGDKSRNALQRLYNHKFLLTGNDIGRTPPTFADASIAAKAILESGFDFEEGSIIFNRFRTVVSYETSKLAIMPLESIKTKEALSTYDSVDDDVLQSYSEYSLAQLIYYAMKESATSEQASRMTAMDGASKNAGEMIDKLTLAFNRTRQAVITRELIEIISGAACV
ncbi:ATP synthase F1, gamma subunit [Dictyocaulus viviparus]|uniref:F-ATPase gamma subunit n=1 Tax=Dictyocaulus viviparus TaxID=29172 RepID=A0A0D8XVE9_DICVI|nr:ATP synthase F1, gamma subunit [Dictyocaulus viviparus]